MIRKLLRRLGVIKSSLAIATVSILFSVLLYLILSSIFEKISFVGIIISMIIPAIIAPLISHFFVRVFLQLDRAEEAVKENEEKYRNLVERANDGIAIVQDGCLKFVNQRLAEMIGYTVEEMTNADFTTYLPPELIPELVDRYKRRMRGETVIQRYEGILIHKDGTERHVDFNAGKTTCEGKVADLVFVRDITDRKRVEREQRELQSRLHHAQKMEAIGTLAGGVAHDLNNILSGIVSYPELILLDMPEDSPLRNPIVTMQKSGEKAAAIVQDLLTLARRNVAVTEAMNVNSIILEYVRSPECEKILSLNPGVHVQLNLEPDLLNILGSPVHLSKTVMNLFSNAAEAMPHGGTILISTENRYGDIPMRGYNDMAEGDYVILKVSDTGIGMSPKDIRRIFEPFYTKKMMGREGTGLGLAVVWGVVKDHKGYIDVESSVGEGTTFTLCFPVTEHEVAKEEAVFPFEDLIGNGESILIVDDVEEQREIASGLLRKLGYSVASVSNGKEAVDYMKGNSADLLILDMIMDPGIDGLETYKRILKFHPGQKAIIASGFSETDRVKEAQRLGAGEYIKKPYTIEKIGLAVKKELDN